jgi:hypothetical protein
MNKNLNKFCKAVECSYWKAFGLKIENGFFRCKSQAAPDCFYLDEIGNIKNNLTFNHGHLEKTQSLKVLSAWVKYIKK